MNLKELFHLLIFNQVKVLHTYEKTKNRISLTKFDYKKQQDMALTLLAPSTQYSYRVNFQVTYGNRVFGRQRAKILNFLPIPLFLRNSPTEFNSSLKHMIFILQLKRDYIFPSTQFLSSTYTPFNNEAVKFLSFIQKSPLRKFELIKPLITRVPPLRRSKRRWNLFLKY